MKEIEIKIKLDDRDALIKKVEDLGGKLIDQGTQYDVIYDDGKGFYDAPKVLRLRKLNNLNILTYKEKLPHSIDSNLLQRVEIQTEVKDYEQTDQIIKRLGFFPHRVKEKSFFDYLLDELKIEFHTVAFLGDFLEIETENIGKLNVLLKKLGLEMTMGINRDYGTLFAEYCQKNNLPLDTPCTFEKEAELRIRN